MDLPAELEDLKSRPISGKMPAKRTTYKETHEIVMFFKKRRITNAGISRAIGFTKEAIGQWFRVGIPKKRLPVIRGLMDKITSWKQKSDKRFPG